MPTRNIQGTQVSRASVIILENNIWQYINANQECIKHSLLKIGSTFTASLTNFYSKY